MNSGHRTPTPGPNKNRRGKGFFMSRSGAVDLSSVATGAAVIGIMSAATAALIFGAVPWSQDRTARQDLAAITVAQSTAELKSNKFLSAGDLASQGLLNNKNGSLVKVFDVKNAAGTKTGECYVGISVSGSGETYYVTNSKTDPVKLPEDASGVGCGTPAAVKQMIGEVNLQVTGTPAAVPAAPELTLTYAGGTKVALSWTPAADATAARKAEFYSLEYRIGTGVWTVLDDRTVDTKATAQGTYGYRISARVRSGNGAGFSAYSAERGVNLLALPAKPVIGGAAATGPSSAGFSWDAVAGAAGYGVDYRVNYGPWLTRSTDQAATTLSVDGLSKGDRVKARVRSLNISGASAFTESGEVTVTGTVGTPVVSGTRSGATTAEFSWESVGSDGYRVESRVGTGAWTVVSELQTATKVSVPGRAGEKIGVRVQASGSTAYSAVSTVTMPVTPPAPSDVVGTLPDNSGAVFTWPVSAGATGYIVELYTATGWEIMPEQSAATFTVETARAVGGRITVRVRAVGEAGTSGPGTNSSVTLPTAPGVPVVTAALRDQSTAEFTWADVAKASSYKAQSRIAGGAWTDLELTAEALNAAVSAAPGQKIEVRVQAVNSVGASAYSAAATLTLPNVPAAPVPAAKALSGTDVLVSWPAVPGADSYKVSSSIAGDRWMETDADGLTALISTGEIPGQIIEMKVYAVNAVGRSVEPAAALKMTLPVITAAPAATASEVTGTGVKISWKAVPGAANYRVETGGSPWEPFGGIVTGTSVVIPALPGETVTARVSAENVAGISEPSTSVKLKMLALPTAPNVRSELTAAQSSRFLWEGVGTATKGYNVEKSINDGAWEPVSSGSKDLAVVLTGAAGDQIKVRVQSVNAAGTSPWSALKSVTLPVAPAAPSVTGEVSSAFTAAFMWNVPAGTDSFRVEYRISGDTAWQVQSANQTAAETTVMAVAGSVVEARVQARNLAGESAWAAASVRMPAEGSAAAQTPVTLKTGGVVGWDAVKGAQRYRIRYTTDGSEPTALNSTQTVQTATSYTVPVPAGTSVKIRVQPGYAADVWGAAYTLSTVIR